MCHDFREPDMRVGTDDLSAALSQIADEIAVVLLRRRHGQAHHWFEHDRVGLG